VLRRHFQSELLNKLRHFPIVTVLGPRQCGKTTFIRKALSRWSYFDLERPSDYIPLSEDPESRLRQLGPRVVFDEAQRLPALFSLLRGIVDRERRRNGRYVLLGSASTSLIREISESLAGRTAFLDMTPFTWDEIAAQRREGVEVLWHRGGFPDAFLAQAEAARWEWFEAYTRTFIERDLPALGINVSAGQMRKLWTMLAHANGGVWNASQLAASLGVSYHTVNHYVDILEQTFLVRKLPPYFANLGKRLVRSPKIYFRDTGLLHYFLGLRTIPTLRVHPARGASWEAFVIEQVISSFQLLMPGASAFFWRTAAGSEADLLIDRGDRRVPFEVKLNASPRAADVRGLLSCMQGLKLRRGYVLHAGENQYSLGNGIIALPVAQALRRPSQLLGL